MHIWQQLQQLHRPIFIQAPMEEAGDSVFRQIIASCGAPDLFFTEFTNVEGLTSAGRTKIIHRLQFTPTETPLIAQIWGQKPENFATVASQLADMGFAGIDINMGCPERSIVRRGSCAGLINHPTLATEIIQATKQAAGNLPVSVKTRCGTSTWVTEEWLSHLLRQNIAALTIHGRIAREMSQFPARWEEIAKAVTLRDQISPNTIIIGNGDINSHAEGLEKSIQFGVDGVMIGRGTFHNPWIFNSKIDPDTVSLSDRLALLRRHVQLFNQTWGTTKNFPQMRRYYKMYLTNIPEAITIRQHLMTLPDAKSTLDYLDGLDSATLETNPKHQASNLKPN